jgi:hypothetical protein
MPMRKVNHSPRSRTEVKTKWRYISIPLICLHFVDREIFTFTLIDPTYFIGRAIRQVLLKQLELGISCETV